jgi:hypothetical protein
MENQRLKNIVQQIGLTPDAKSSRKKITSIATDEFVMSNAYRELLEGAKTSPKEFTALTGLDPQDTRLLQQTRDQVSARVIKTSPQRLGPGGVLLPSVKEAQAARQLAKQAGAQGIAAEQKIQQRGLLEQIPAYLQGFAGGGAADIVASKLKAKGYDPTLAYVNAGSDTDYAKQLGAETGYTFGKTMPATAVSVPTMGLGGAAGDIATGALTSGVTSLSPAWMRAIAGGVRFAGHLGGAIQGGHIGSSLTEKAQEALTSGNLTPEERGVGQSMFGPQTPGGQLGATAATLSLFKPTIKLAGAPLRKLVPQVFQDYGMVAKNPYMMASVKDLGTRGFFVAQAGDGVDKGNQQAIKDATEALGYVPTDINQLKNFGYKTQFEKLADMGMAALLGGTTRLGSALSRMGHIDTTPRPEFNVNDITGQIENLRNKRNQPAQPPVTEPGMQTQGVATAGSFPRFETIEGGVPITVEERSGTEVGISPTRKESGEVVQKFNALFGRNANKEVAFTPTSDGPLKLIGMNADNDFNVIVRNADGTPEVKSYGWTELPEQLKEQANSFFGTTIFIDRSTPEQQPYKYDPSAVSEEAPGRERRTYNTENDLRGVPIKDKSGNWKADIYKLRKDGVDIPVRAVSDVDTRNESVGVRTFSGNYYRVPVSALRDGADKPITTVKQSSWPERAYRKSYRPNDVVGEAVRFAESDWRISPEDREKVTTGDEEGWKDSYDIDNLEANYAGAREKVGELQQIERGTVFADRFSGDRVVLLSHVDQTVEGRRMVGMLVYDVDSRVYEPYVMSYADAVDVSEAVKIKESLKKEPTAVEDAKVDTTDEGEDIAGPEDGTEGEGPGGGPEDGTEGEGPGTEGEGPGTGTEGEGPGAGTEGEGPGGPGDGTGSLIKSRGDSGVDFVKSQIVRYLKAKTNATKPSVTQQELESQDFIPQTLEQLKRFKDTGTRQGVNREIVDQAYSELEEDGIIVAPSEASFDKEVMRGANFDSAVEKLEMGVQTPRDASLSFGDKFSSKDVEPEENLPQRTTSTQGKATGEREEGYEWYRQTEGEEVRTTASVTQEEIKSILKAYSPLQSRPRVISVNQSFTSKENATLVTTLVVEGVSSEQDVVRVLQQRWNSTEQEAKALAKYVDSWATGWSMTVARMEGVNINKRLLARKTDAEKQSGYTAFVQKSVAKELKDAGVNVSPESIKRLAIDAINNNGKISVDGKQYTVPIVESYAQYDTWKKDFREISIFNNTEANKQLLADLKQIYYEQHLGNFGQLSAGAAELMRPGSQIAFVNRAVRTLMDGTVESVGRVIAVETNTSIENKLHELHHALLESMPRAVYHDILKSRFPSIEMTQLQYGTDRGLIDTAQNRGVWINTTHEEEMVAALTNAVMTSDINSYPFRYRYGIDAYEVHVAQAVVELGQMMRAQNAVIKQLEANTPYPSRQIGVMGNYTGRGEVLSGEEVAGNTFRFEYTRNTLVRVKDNTNNVFKEGRILNVNEFKAVAGQKIKIADVTVEVKFPNDTKTYKLLELLDKADIEKLFLYSNKFDMTGIDVNKLGEKSKYNISRQGYFDPQLKEAGDAVARVFGHYQKFVNQQIKDVAPIMPSKLAAEINYDSFDIANAQKGYPYSAGYRWYVNTEAAAKQYGTMGKPQPGYYQGPMNEKRLSLRMRDSYLGWLDVGGYTAWVQLSGNETTTSHEKHIKSIGQPTQLSYDLMLQINNDANAREQAWYASRETGAGSSAGTELIKVEGGDLEPVGGEEPFKLDFDVMGTPDITNASDRVSSPQPESEINVDEGLTVDKENVDRYGNPVERRYISRETLTNKLANEDKIVAEAIMSKLAEGDDAAEIYNGKTKRTVGFYLAEYDEAGKSSLANKIRQLFKDSSDSGTSDDVVLDYLSRIKNDSEKVEAITKHVVDLLTNTSQRRAEQDARFGRVARTRQEIARAAALNRMSDDIHTSLKSVIERSVSDRISATVVDGEVNDTSMTYDQKQSVLQGSKADIIDALRDQYNGVLDDAMIAKMVDQSIEKILSTHVMTESEAQNAQEVRAFEDEQLKLQLKIDRQDNNGEQAQFFQKQLSTVLEEAMKDKAKAASNNGLWRRVIANNIFGAYINNWVMKGFRMRVPEAMYLRYPLAKNTRVLDYLAGSFDVGTIRSGLSIAESKLSTWGDQQSNIRNITNSQYRQVEILRTTWRQIMRNIYKAEFANKGLSPAREITELNNLMDVFRKEYKLDESGKVRAADVIEKNKDLIQTFLSKTKDPELKQRFIDWVYEYNSAASQSTYFDKVIEDLGEPKEKRKGYSTLRVESSQYDDMLDGKKVVYYVSNWGTLGESIAHVKAQQTTIQRTLDSWNPFGPKSTEFKREFVETVNTEVLKEVRNLILNTRQVTEGGVRYYIYDSYNQKQGLTPSEKLTFDQYTDVMIRLMRSTARNATGQFFAMVDSKSTLAPDITVKIKRAENELDNDVAWKNTQPTASQHQEEALRRHTIFSMATGIKNRGAIADQASRVIESAMQASRDVGNEPGKPWKTVDFNGVKYKTEESFNSAISAYDATGHAYIDVVDAVNEAIRIKKSGALESDAYGFTDLSLEQLNELASMAKAAEGDQQGFDDFREYIEKTAYTRNVPGLLFRASMHERQSAFQPTVWSVGADSKRTLKMLGIDVTDVEAQIKSNRSLLERKMRQNSIARTVSNEISKDDETFTIEQGFTFDYLETMDAERADRVEFFNLFNTVNASNSGILTKEFSDTFIRELANRPFVMKIGVEKATSAADFLTLNQTIETINRLSSEIGDYKQMLKVNPGDKDITERMNLAVKDRAELNKRYKDSFDQYEKTNDPMFKLIGKKIDALTLLAENFADGMGLKGDARLEKIGELTGVLYDLAVDMQGIKQSVDMKESEKRRFFIANLLSNAGARNARTLFMASTFAGYSESLVLRGTLDKTYPEGTTLRTALNEMLKDSNLSINELIQGLSFTTDRLTSTVQSIISERGEYERFIERVQANEKLWNGTKTTNGYLDQPVKDIQANRDLLRVMNNEIRTTEFLINKIVENYRKPANATTDMSMLYEQLVKSVTPLEDMVLEMKRQHVLKNGMTAQDSFSTAVMGATQRGTGEVQAAIKSAIKRQTDVENGQMQRHLDDARLNQDGHYNLVARGMKRVLRDVERMEDAFGFLAKDKKSIPVDTAQINAQLKQHGDYVSFVVLDEHVKGATSQSWLSLRGQRILVPSSFYSPTTGRVTFKSNHSFLPNNLTPMEKEAYILTSWFVENNAVDGLPIGRALSENIRTLFSRAISDFSTSKQTEQQFKSTVLRYTNDVLDSLVMRFPLRNENLRYTNTGSITIKDQVQSDVPKKIQSWLQNNDVNHYRYSTKARNFNFEQLLTRLKADGIEVSYLSNKDLWALTEKQGTTPNRYATWRDLVDARDKYIVDPLKARLESSSKLMSQMSFHELNMELRDSMWTNSDRAAFFADYWNVTQTRQGNIPRDYMIATGEFPTKDALRQYIDRTMQGKSEDERLLAYTEQVKNLDALEQMIATAGYEAAIKTSSITQAEVRYNNDPEASYILTGIMRDVKADTLDGEQQQVRETLLSQTELLTNNENSVVSDLLKQVGELKTDAKNLMIDFLNNPEKLNIKNVTDILLSGSQPAGAKNIKIPAMKGKAIEGEAETRRMAVHVETTATNNLKALQEGIKDGALSLEISRNLAELGVNVGRGQVKIQDLITGHSSLVPTRSMTTAQQQHVTLIASKVRDYVQAQARVLIGARLELVRSMNDFAYVGYEYRQNGAEVDVYDQGIKKYTINYKTGKVSTINHEQVLAIGSQTKIAEWSKLTNGLDVGFQEQLKVLDYAQIKQLDLLMTIAKRPGEMYIGGSLETHADAVKTLVENVRINTKAVPAVYWHGIANMRRPEDYGPTTEMYTQPAMSPARVDIEYGTIDPGVRRSFVNPVINKWLQPAFDRSARVVLNHNNEVGRDEYGYSVYREDGNRSHIYRNLVESGLGRNKALEVYALTEHPSFKSWTAGTMLDNLESMSAGTALTMNAQVKPEQFKAQRVFDAMKLRQTLKYQLTNPSEETYDNAKRLYGETLGSHLNDAQLDRSFDKLTNKGENVAPIMMEVDRYIDRFMSADIAKMTKIYDSQLQAEERIMTGAPFTTLAFRPDVDGMLYDTTPGIQVHDLVTGSHIRENRMQQPRFIKMENPLVIDAGNTGLSVPMRNEAIKDAVKGKHDGVVFTNVVQTVTSPKTTAVAYTLNDANVRSASNMLGESTDSIEKPTAKVITDYTTDIPSEEYGSAVTTSPMAPILYQGKEAAPPLAISAGQIKTNKTIGMKALDGLDQLEKEWQGLTRLSLALDLAYPIIQGGKYGMGMFTGRFNDTKIWVNAFKSAAKGLAPRIAFTGEKGKQIGAHMGRREYIKLFLEYSNDPYYEVMKELGVPLNFYNYERAIGKSRQRAYQEAKGKTAWQDVFVDLMQISEVGHVQQDMVKDAMVNKIPVAGMAERFTSLNHDILMFNLVKYQLQNNPLLKDVPLKDLKYEQSAKETANFVALSLGDFQYSTNEDIDMVVGRAAKWVSVAPRWQLANWLMKPHWNFLFGSMRFTRKLLGENNRVFNSIATNQSNPALRAYQYNVIYGSMLWTLGIQQAVHYLGQLLFKREDVKQDPTKIGKFRIGDWVYADSSGVWDDINKLRGVYDAIAKPIKTDEKFGDTPELDWLIGASNRLGYNVSPALIKLIFEPLSGKDVIGRSVYERDEEWRYVYDKKIKPAVAFAPENWNMSQYITSTFPTGLNEVVDTTFETKYESPLVRDAAILTQTVASTLGTRLQYDKYIPGRLMKREKIKRQHQRNWQSSPTLIDVIGKANKRNQGQSGQAALDVIKKVGTGKF